MARRYNIPVKELQKQISDGELGDKGDESIFIPLAELKNYLSPKVYMDLRATWRTGRGLRKR